MTLLINDHGLGQAPSKALQPATSWSWVFTLFVFTPLYFLALVDASYFALGREAISVFWPANGLLLGALLLNRPARWPALILISLVCESIHAFAFSCSAAAQSVVLHLANPLEVLLAGWLIVLFIRYAGPASYARKSLVFILLASVIAAGCGSLLGASAFVQSMPQASFAYTWQVWWLSDGLGFIVVTPAVVAWGERVQGKLRPLEPTLPRVLETVFMTLGLIAAVVFVFGSTHEAPFSVFDFPYITVPFALWAAFRLTGDGAALIYLVLSGLAVWFTAGGTGPYQVLDFDPQLQVLSLQTYLFFSFFLILLINAVIRDRDDADCQRRQADRALVRAQHMTRVSQFAGGVAHDLNNCLCAIMNCTEMLQRDKGKSDISKQMFQVIETSSFKGAALAKKLMTLGSADAAALQPCDLGEIVKGVAPMLRQPLGHGHTLTCSCCEGLPTVMADPIEIDEILMNLVINAGHAMPTGGAVEVVIAPPDGEALKQGGSALSGESHVMLKVSDTGEGMDDDSIEQAFEPYYTTRKDSGGTGLGLPRVYAIVQRHNAILHVRSHPGQGTCFRILFPVC
jgi:signal transduction histidine kinase